MSTAPPSRSPLATAAELSRYGVLILVFYSIATYLVGASVRLGFPYALEWIEGAVVDQIARVVGGLPIYVAPSVDYVPQLSPPVYYWVSAAFAKAIGIGFAAPRLVSLLATLGVMGTLYGYARRETASRQPALIAAALYAATYPLSGSWFDLARVDSLALLLALLAVLTLRGARSNAGHALAAGLLGAAFFTDQIYLVAVAALSIHCVIAKRGLQRFVFPLVALGLIGGGSALADRISDGWFAVYVFDVPRAHLALGAGGVRHFAGTGDVGFWRELGGTLPFAALLAVGFVWTLLRAPTRETASFHLLFAAGMIGASWLQRAGLGHDADALMPVHALIALYAALAIHAIPDRFRTSEGRFDAGRKSLAEIGVHTLCILQLLVLVYDPGAEMPRDADREHGARLVDWMQQIDDPIWSPAHGQLPRQAGHAPSAHIAAVLDVVEAGGDVGEDLARQVEEALAHQRYRAIYAPVVGFEPTLRIHYRPTRMGVPDRELTHPRGPEIARAYEFQLPRPH